MKIILEPYNIKWKTHFNAEKHKIAIALHGLDPAIEHIGSTSVYEMWAKPIIDILVGIENNSDLEKVINPMIGAGYTYNRKVEPLMPYRKFFVKLVNSHTEIIEEGDKRGFGVELQSLANIHILQKGTEHWTRHIAFRDYLRAHPEVRQQYIALKKEIAKLDLADHLEYNSHKNDFIKEIEAKAVEWYGRIN